jgi:hypothetical protein
MDSPPAPQQHLASPPPPLEHPQSRPAEESLIDIESLVVVDATSGERPTHRFQFCPVSDCWYGADGEGQHGQVGIRRDNMLHHLRSIHDMAYAFDSVADKRAAESKRKVDTEEARVSPL